MQVFVHCDDPGCDEDLIRRIEGVIEGKLERFGSRISRVEARLSDGSSARHSHGSKVCCLEAWVPGAAPMVALHTAVTLAEAIHDAADKLERMVARMIRQLDAAMGHSSAGASTQPR